MNERTTAPLKTTLLFMGAGGFWISFSDMLVARYVHDPEDVLHLSLYKGWAFVLVTAGILYWLLCRYMSALVQSETALLQRNKDLTTTEESLRVSHREFVALVDSIEGIVWECEGSSLRFTFVSRNAEQMIGYPVSAWLSEPDFWGAHLHPEDRQDAMARLKSAVREQQGGPVEHRFVTPHGGTVWVRNNITVGILEGGVTLRGVMYDITSEKSVQRELNDLNLELEQRVAERTAQLEQANHELQAVFQALPDVFLRIARNGTILDCKAGCADTFAAGEAVGRDIRELLPPRAVEQLDEDFQMMSASKGLSSFEFVGSASTGEKFYEARLLPFREEEIIVLIRNITERKRAEQEIRILNEDLQRRACQLQEINSELESFSYSVSHDLRTPLRHIEGFSKALYEDCSTMLDADGKMYLQRVRGAAQRMEQLIDDMLKLANVTSSTLTRQTVNLSGLAWSIARDLHQTQPERKVTFRIAADVMANGDQRLLRVVLANLLENAWKYTGRQERAELEFGCMVQDGVTVYFVRDNGAGFDMAYSDKLFSAFQRLHGAEEFDGNGIGLATVQRVIRRHGGKIWGEGDVGNGAVFYFTLGQIQSDEIGE